MPDLAILITRPTSVSEEEFSQVYADSDSDTADWINQQKTTASVKLSIPSIKGVARKVARVENKKG